MSDVGGDVIVYGNATLEALSDVGGDVIVYGNAKLEAKALKTVGSDVIVYGKATLSKKYKQNTGKGEALKQKLSERLIKKFLKKELVFADGILTHLILKRKSGKITFYKTRKIGSEKIVYVARKGNLFAHGETPKKASEDLRYKISDRDTSKYKSWTIETIKPIEEIISSYRAITGACFEGTKMFCEGKKLPAKITIKKAIDLTLGQYGNEQFKKFFTEK